MLLIIHTSTSTDDSIDVNIEGDINSARKLQQLDDKRSTVFSLHGNHSADEGSPESDVEEDQGGSCNVTRVCVLSGG